MGISVYPMVIVGIPLSELVKVEKTEETYDLYDKRGNKTGETGVDTKYRFSLEKNGEELGFIQDNENIYSDSFEELGLEDYPSYGKFGVFSTNYETNNLETFIVGVKLLEVNAMYTDETHRSVPLEDYNSAVRKVTNILQTVYNCDVEPTIHLYGNASY